MARFKGNNLSGAIGNIIFYTADGQNRARAKPGKRKRKRGQPADPNTSIFGIVSANGTPMLKLLKTQLLIPFGLSSYNDGRGWMRNHYAANSELPQWHISARPNDMCQLNTASDLRDMLFTTILVTDNGSGKLLISIPALNPVRDMKKLPAQTGSVNIKLAVLHSAFDGKSAVQIAVEQYSLPYTNTTLPAKDMVINTKAAPGNMAIVIIAIEPFAADKPLTAEWLPAAIVAMGRFKQ